jgi:hypothetical protein
MAAPEYVPIPPTVDPRLVWESSPRVPDSWLADRPGDFPRESQPFAPRLGNPGPDVGYAFKLAEQFHGKLSLAEGEHEADAIAGCMQVAMKRAAMYGRAPVMHDLTIAFTLWGFLDERAPADLVDVRRPLFENLGHINQYKRKRQIADAVPFETLRKTPATITQEHTPDWRSMLDLSVIGPADTGS